MKTLLAVGDKTDFDAFGKFYRERALFQRSKWSFKWVNYNDLLKNKTPKITAPAIIILLFFPFEHWNEKIETKKYRGIYGNKTFHAKFKKFWGKVDFCLKRAYPDKELFFLNHPDKAGDCRDKALIKRCFSEKGVPSPKSYNTKNFRKICEYLKRGKKLFIKVRFGSMGKGITCLSKEAWQTNFDYRRNKIISRKSDYGWSFRDITGNSDFLKKLLKGDVIIEKAVDGLRVKDKIFDLRLYVFFDHVLFIYPRTNNSNNVITNISQGAHGESSRFLKYISPSIIAQAKRHAIAAAKAMGLNFAGVDILVDSNAKNIYVLEVNAFPGFPRNNVFNLSRHMIKSLCREKDVVRR